MVEFTPEGLLVDYYVFPVIAIITIAIIVYILSKVKIYRAQYNITPKYLTAKQLNIMDSIKDFAKREEMAKMGKSAKPLSGK